MFDPFSPFLLNYVDKSNKFQNLHDQGVHYVNGSSWNLKATPTFIVVIHNCNILLFINYLKADTDEEGVVFALFCSITGVQLQDRIQL